jgi:thiamine-monophosphate kinase
MGATPTAAVAAYAAPSFDPRELRAFIEGASAVCDTVGAKYVGGDLDEYEEFTVTSTAVGETNNPARRSGATPGEAVVVTGSFGRSGAALELFERGSDERANELFRFTPRIAAGKALAPAVGALMDSSDGLARSLHQLAAASDCGFEIEWDRLPVHPAVEEVAADDSRRRELAAFFGEDFELVATVPESRLEALREQSPTELSVIGTVTEADTGIVADGDPVPDRGYTHGDH